MKNLFTYLLLIIVFSYCSRPKSLPETTLFESEAFTLTNFGVKQDHFEARVHGDSAISSNYFNEPRDLKFKFALNGEDNEMAFGIDHHLILYPDSTGNMQTPIISFGTQLSRLQADTSRSLFLEPNTSVTFRVDLNPVFEEITKNGIYKGANNVMVKGISSIAVLGSKPPLDWDFAGTKNKLKDEDGDGIYEYTAVFNPIKVENGKRKWQLERDLTGYASFKSSNLPLLDALYNLSLEELEKLRTETGYWDTGAKWSGVWTRDMSYSILLSLAYLDPETAKACLRAKVNKNGRIIQDTGTGGSWPISSDRMTWSLAAWEIWKVTGDIEWIQEVYPILLQSVRDDLTTVVSPDSLIYGETTFADWREQSYPKWMSPVDIYTSEGADNNMVHFKTWKILSEMAYLMNDETVQFEFESRSETLKHTINTTFWQENAGYYAQFTYGKGYTNTSPRAMALAESFSILFDVAAENQQLKIASSTPVVDWGIPTFYPQIPEIPSYHNNGIWPFVQAFWNWSLAKVQHEEALTHGLASMWRAAALFLTNKENMRADNGNDYPTEINSDRQLWSVAGNLAMYYRVFFGMDFKADGLHLNPIVPQAFTGDKFLNGFRYRNASIQLTVKGFGAKATKITINGQPATQAFIPADASGTYQIEIELDNLPFGKGSFNLTENAYSLATPEIRLSKRGLEWNKIEGAVRYEIYRNGSYLEETDSTFYRVGQESIYSVWQIKAIATNRLHDSFLSNPVELVRDGAQIWAEVEWFGKYTRQGAKEFKGYGFLKSKHDDPETAHATFTVYLNKSGSYLLDVRYSNGNGPINTENKVAIRSLFANNARVATMVFPQRGTNEWSNWGMSNAVKLELKSGKNSIELRFEPENANMNGNVNEYWLDAIRLVKME